MLTVREVAELLNVSVGCVYGLVSKGRLRCHRIGLGRGTIRVNGDDLDEYLAECRIQDNSSTAAGRPPGRQGRPFTHLDGERLRSAWQKQGVHAGRQDARNARSSE